MLRIVNPISEHVLNIHKRQSESPTLLKSFSSSTHGLSTPDGQIAISKTSCTASKSPRLSMDGINIQTTIYVIDQHLEKSILIQ